MRKEAEFYFKQKNGSVQCLLCPNKCMISEHFSGLCMARTNIGGILYNNLYSEIVALNDDPIEKKPLYHFYPKSKVMSLGSNGCNYDCPFCHNVRFSRNQTSRIPVMFEEIINLTKDRDCIGIAYTYNEPIVNYEFVRDLAVEAKVNRLKNILVTNGSINHIPLNNLLPLIDAVNVDLKGFSEETYSKLKGHLATTMATIESFINSTVHIEITFLLVPTLNNDVDEFKKMCHWLASLNPAIPLHINKYYPAYKFNQPATTNEELLKFYNIAKETLQFVYIGNANIETMADTICPNCFCTVIRRKVFDIDMLTDKPKCQNCNKSLPIVF